MVIVRLRKLLISRAIICRSPTIFTIPRAIWAMEIVHQLGRYEFDAEL
jgi:hypothetical protein